MSWSSKVKIRRISLNLLRRKFRRLSKGTRVKELKRDSYRLDLASSMRHWVEAAST